MRSNETDAARPIDANARVEQHAVEPQRDEVRDVDLAGDAEGHRAREAAEDLGRDDQPDEREARDELREVGDVARERPRQQDLQRAALPLSGNRGRREADREDADEGDGDRVQEAECDRAGEAEDVAATELRERLGQDAALGQLPELGAELRVDHRAAESPRWRARCRSGAPGTDCRARTGGGASR